MTVQVGAPEPDGNVIRRHLAINGASGTIPGRLTTPDGNDAPSTLVLLGHGGGGGKDERGFPQLAARFATGLGAAVLAIDGPAHGERTPSEGDEVERFRAGRRALVDPAVHASFADDWKTSVAACRDLGLGHGQLLYAGFSMGTLYGVPTVAALGDVTAAVFGVGGVPRKGGVAELVRAIAGEEAARITEEEDNAELRGQLVVDAARKISGTEVLMINMTHDEVFPVEGALELFAAFDCPKRIAFWEGTHTGLPSEAMALAIDFLNRVVARGSADTTTTPGAW